VKFKASNLVVAVTLFSSLVMAASVAAQESSSKDHKSKHQQYKLVDLGTFGGPNFFFNFSGSPNTLLNNKGTVTGGADTSIVDTRCFDNPDCFVLHASKWQEGVLTDLGALPGGSNSQAFWVNEHGQITGFAQSGINDPLLGIQRFHAVLWSEGNIIDLGTLGGDESISQAINDQAQVVGDATLNDNPDPLSFLGAQTHPFIWEKGTLQDLGTLGGPDAFAYLLNKSGQVAGVSYTSSTRNPPVGFGPCSSSTGLPTQDGFLWEEGKLIDLGSFGGTCTTPDALNNRGQVVGESNLAGDLTSHPFSWTKSGGIQDLGTFGGDFGVAGALNDAGQIVGIASTSGNQSFHGALWSSGKMTDLGFIAGCMGSDAVSINASGQVVGSSYGCGGSSFLAAFLWENGGPMVDLNTLVLPHPGVQLDGGDIYINDRGEILSSGTLQNGDRHAFLLNPDRDCNDDCEARVAASQNTATPAPNSATMKQRNETFVSPLERFRSPMRQRYHISGQPAVPGN
jgi:probable HAF family extracellular repeat protein